MFSSIKQLLRAGHLTLGRLGTPMKVKHSSCLQEICYLGACDATPNCSALYHFQRASPYSVVPQC